MSEAVELGFPSLRLVPKTTEKQSAKDFKTDQEVRWCPGCGDYAILAAVQGFLPELGIKRENIVFVSGIGCSSRFPYYMNTYGMHSIHGRAPAVAVGAPDGQPGTVAAVPPTAVPVVEARYSGLRAVKGGLAWLREPVSGVLGEGVTTGPGSAWGLVSWALGEGPAPVERHQHVPERVARRMESADGTGVPRVVRVRAAVPVDAGHGEARDQFLALSTDHGRLPFRDGLRGVVPDLSHRDGGDGMSQPLQLVIVSVLVDQGIYTKDRAVQVARGILWENAHHLHATGPKFGAHRICSAPHRRL